MSSQKQSVGNNIEITTMSDEEAARVWAAEHKILKDATGKLFEERFGSLDAIKLVDVDELIK